MSILEIQDVECPACELSTPFEVVHSVLADRRPDLRAAIIEQSFQADVCRHCGAHFRQEPELNYLDIGRGQWILSRPAGEVTQWQALEAQALGLFELGYGVLAPAPAQEIGRGLSVRVAFGWPALREKLLANEAGLDDAVVEVLKLSLMAHLDGPALGDTTELRLVRADENGMDFAWLEAGEEQWSELISVPRMAYDELADAPEGHAELRARLMGGPFVDISRILIDPADAAEDEAALAPS